ncbi:MAG: MFS transporter, partial [Pelagibacterales bacterium]|nr:MFS transporter [Pelagibacterales bacterium]
MLKKKNQFFYIMLVLCAGYTVSQFLRTSIGVLSPNLMIGFNINPNDMGLLGGVFFLSFAVFQIPAGILIDRYGPRMVMTITIFFAVIGSILFALSNSFNDLLIGRILMGLGCSICLMGSLVLITRWADRNSFSKLAGIILAIGGLGGLLATTPLSFLSELYGWKLSFWIASAITFIVMILYYTVLKDTREGMSLNLDKKAISLKNTLVIFKEKNFKYMIPMSL